MSKGTRTTAIQDYIDDNLQAEIKTSLGTGGDQWKNASIMQALVEGMEAGDDRTVA